MERRDLIRAAAVTSAGALVGLDALWPSSYAAPSAADKSGIWEPLIENWPLVPIHAVLLGDGQVLTYGTDGQANWTGTVFYDIWNE